MATEARNTISQATTAGASGFSRPFAGVRFQTSALERTISLLSPLLLLGVWEVLAQRNVIDTRFFPAPHVIFAAAWQMLLP